MKNISAVIVVYNEEENIRECIATLGFSEEILVIDTGSDDETAVIASSLGARVIQAEVNYPEFKKNIGIDEARSDWIFVIDADERVTPELASEIESLADDGDTAGYGIYRKNFFMGKEIRRCGWESDRVVRLFRKESGRYPDKLVHGVLSLKGPEKTLKGRLEHHSYRKVSDYLKKVDKYTLWAATERKKKTGPLKLFFNPFFRFHKMYFLRLGFLDGAHGFALCAMASFSVFLKYFRAYLGEKV